MKQPERPTQIAAILETINSEYPAELTTELEDYITDLESRQQVVVQNNNVAALDQEKIPIWSYQRVIKREQRRRENALKKQNQHR